MGAPRTTRRWRLLWLAACMAFPAAAQADDRSAVRIAGSTWIADAPTSVADALGYFNQPGSHPRIRVDRYDSGQQALTSLLAGEAEFALATSTPVAKALIETAHETAPPLIVLGATSLSNRTHLVIANGATGIRAPADLAGRRVGLMLDTSGHFGWTQFARHHRLEDAAVTLVDMPIATHRQALLNGDIDAAAMWEPWATAVANSLRGAAQVFTTRHLYTVSWLLLTRTEVLEEHPGLAERVLGAYRKAINTIDADLHRAMVLHARATGAGHAELTDQQAGIIWGLRLDWPVVADLESQFRWLADRSGQGPGPMTYHYMDAAPLRAVDPRAVTLPDYFFVAHRVDLEDAR